MPPSLSPGSCSSFWCAGTCLPASWRRGAPNEASRFIPRYFHCTWAVWSGIGRRIRTEERRERFLAFYGPLAMIVLIGLWAAGLIVGFGLMQAGFTPGPWPKVFGESLYSAGSRMFTVDSGDWARNATMTKVLVVVGSGMGLGFFTVVITHLPVLYQLCCSRLGRRTSSCSTSARARRSPRGH